MVIFLEEILRKKMIWILTAFDIPNVLWNVKSISLLSFQNN